MTSLLFGNRSGMSESNTPSGLDRAMVEGGRAEFQRIFTAAYWKTGGDVRAMTEILLAVVGPCFLDKARKMPPPEIDGEVLSPEAAVVKTLNERAREAVAHIEGHGQTRH